MEGVVPTSPAQNAASTPYNTPPNGTLGATSKVDGAAETVNASGTRKSEWTPETVTHFFELELLTPELDELYPFLWAFARKSGSHIDALHVQVIKRRSIVAAEAPRLHLVWETSRIFIKPIPPYLLDDEFWKEYLSIPGHPHRQVALGFLRSYAWLIRHRSDFVLAQQSHLLPPNCTWEHLSEYLRHFRHLPDSEVSKRYAYGQLRLARLNHAVRLIRPASRQSNWFYQPANWSTLPYLQAASVPLLFLFATLSLALSAMQVMLAVPTEQIGLTGDGAYRAYAKAFWGFSIASIVFNAAVWSLLLTIPAIVLLTQLVWGYRHRNGAEEPF